MAALAQEYPGSAIWFGNADGILESRPEWCLIVRPRFDRKTRRQAESLHRNGCLLIMDFDDLLATGPVEENPFVLGGRLSIGRAIKYQEQYRMSLTLADAVTVSTSALAERMAMVVGTRPVVICNGLPRNWLDLPNTLAPRWRPGMPRVMRYFSGSHSHDHDLLSVLPIISRLLKTHNEVRFEIVGNATVPRDALPIGRWSHQPFVAYNRLPMLLASSWVTIAPLIQTSFNACKSAIKFLESAAWGAPCVVSPNEDMKRCLPGGVCIAENSDAWWDHLNALFNDDYRMSLSAQGEAWVKTYACAENGVHELNKLIRSLGVN